MNDIDELCRLVNSMAVIQSVGFERRYNFTKEWLVNVLTITFAPEINYAGERLLKAEFFGVCEFKAGDLFTGIFPPFISITDISYRNLESIHFLVREEEGHFSFMCERFEFEITEDLIK